jgi:hypothetical protein
MTEANNIENLSESWKGKFCLIEKAGGTKLNKINELSFRERMKVNFNILAFLFCPFYYVFKGMWKKGLSLFAICAVVVIVLSIPLDLAGLEKVSDSLGVGVGYVFATRANIDYYKKMILGKNGWW